MSSFIIAGYLWRILGRGPKTPPYPWAALKKPILNRVKAGKNANNETDFYYDAIFNFRKFYRDFGKFKKTTSLDSKLSEIFTNSLKTSKILYPRVMIQKNGKIKLWTGPINLTLNTSILSEYLNKEDNFFDPNQYKILRKKKQESEPTEEKIERESQKPLWFEINKQQFEKLRREVYNNQDNKNFKITINKKSYDLKNAKKLWTEVTTRKISKSEAKNCTKNWYKKTLMQ